MGVFNQAINEAAGLDVGDIVQVRDYALDNAKERIWNGAIGEVIAVNGVKVQVRVTNIKQSNVAYSVKWRDKLENALKHKLTLEKGEFIILRDN